MTSSFTWLDYSERERRAMLDVVDLFREQDTRDEMGLATVRDALADLLFPGTTSVQTRARYFLFVPWIYLDLERKAVPSAKVEARARQEEAKLIEALRANEGSAQGVIGAVAGAAIHRLPSSIYWHGLSKWGILLFPGAQDAYHRSLDRFYARRATRLQTDDGEAFDRLGRRNWDSSIPPRPDGFPEKMGFGLCRAEALYLQEQILRRAPATYLALLAVGEEVDGLTCDYPWEAREAQHLPEPLATHLRHARCFAEAMHGSGLLYNLMLSEISGREESAQDYAEGLAAWAAEMEARRGALAAWWAERDVLWRLAGDSRGAPVPIPVRIFVERWITWLLEQPGVPDASGSSTARGYVRDREEALKRGLSRFTNRRALEMWGGWSGAARLGYRWGRVRQIVTDIRNGLAAGDDHARTA